MDHVASFKYQKTPSSLRTSATRAAKLRKVPITKETFVAFVWISTFVVWFGGSILVGISAHWLGALGPVPYVMAALAYGALYYAVKSVFGMEPMQAILDSLGTFDDLKLRRHRLQQVVETCVKLEEATARFALSDQLRTWGSLTALEDGIEDLVVLRRRLSLVVRDPATVTGPMPRAIADYVDYTDGLFHKTMHPKALAASVQGFMDGYLASATAPRWHARKLAEMGQMAFVETCPRFDIRSNIDWVLANAWCVAGHEHLAGEDAPRGDLMDEIDRSECVQAAYLSWWDHPRERRSSRLSFDRVLLCAPSALFVVRAVDHEPKDRQYPISIGTFAVVGDLDAPVEYVKKLWESTQGARYPERMSLRRIVNAARLLHKGSKS